MNKEEKIELLTRVSENLQCTEYDRCGDIDFYGHCYACSRNLVCDKEEGQDYRNLYLLIDELKTEDTHV